MLRNNVGLVVGRFQPLHRGHLKIISRMIYDCPTAIVCIGSAQKKREEHDPWTVEERMTMLKNVYGDRIKIVPLNDLGATSPDGWVKYIFEKLEKLGMPKPTDYYTGSEADAQWYKTNFYNSHFDNLYVPDVQAKDLKEGPFKRQTRRLHILDRDINPVPAATEIRMWLQTRDRGWQKWVPNVNHNLIEETYPEEFQIPLT